MNAPAGYRRDATTWSGFALLGVWALFIYFFGPASSAIASDLGLSTSAAGGIGTALAVGMVVSVLLGPPAVRRWGRRGTLMRLLPAVSASAALLAVGSGYLAVLLATAAVGLFGVVVANTATAVLADHHPRQAARAITEANAVASWVGVASPVMLGFALTLASGWRGAALVLAVLPALAMLRLRTIPLTPVVAGKPDAAGGGGPSPAFLPSLVVVSAAVAMEFSINFWAGPLIRERTGAGLSQSATALAALTLGMALARTFAAGLAGRYPLPNLIIACFAVSSVGLAGLLTATVYATAVASLFVAGLGLSLLFPCAQTWAVTLAAGGTDRAVALTSLAAGLALGLAPFLLGVLADAVGLRGALSAGFAVAAVGVVMAVVVRAVERARA